MGRVRHVGRVSVEVTITNGADEATAERGFTRPQDIRSLTLPDVLVDTGANTLCLPKHMVETLGLTHLETAIAGTAGGDIEVDVFKLVTITVLGRTGTVDCVQLPDDAEPLLGLLPLERLGLEPDLQNESLRELPRSGIRNYWTIL